VRGEGSCELRDKNFTGNVGERDEIEIVGVFRVLEKKSGEWVG
jgi:hypothetical protein